MKLLPVALGTALGAAAAARGATSAQLCQGHSVESGGNWYCQAVQQIIYQSIGGAGQYQDVVGMDQSTGACSQQAKAFSGPLAPFNEPISLHFRGPLYLKQLAVYMPNGNAKREEMEDEQNETVAQGQTEAIRQHHHEHEHARLSTREEMPDGKVPDTEVDEKEADHGEEKGRGVSSQTEVRKGTESHNHNHNHDRHKRHHRHREAHMAKGTGDVDEDLHQEEADTLEKREQWVTATIDDKVVSWVNNYLGPVDQKATPPATASLPHSSAAVGASAADVGGTTTIAFAVAFPPAAAPGASSLASPLGGAASAALKQPPPSPSSSPLPASSPLPSPSPSLSPSSSSGGGYARVAYYNAPEQKASGMTFLGNFGGQGSGKWTTKFGNTISYINAQGTGGASKATVLSNTTIPSGSEVIVMSDQACDSSCGYVQPGAVAYKGFGGTDKAILLDFTMPHEGATAGFNADMPAVWMLNARIPRTAQYDTCSCWASGCGELDVFEVLSPGDARCKSTVHGGRPGGDSNYFARPAAALMRAAVVFDLAGGVVAIKVLSTDAGGMGDLPAALTLGDVKGYLADGGSGGLSSVFTIA